MVPRPHSEDGLEDAFHQARQRAARDPLLSSAKDGYVCSTCNPEGFA